MVETKKVELNEDKLPEGWAAATLGDIASYIQRGKSPKYTEFSELPVVNQKCVRWNGIDREHLKYIHPGQFEKWEEKRFLKEGDLLWNSTGTGTIGRAAIVHLKDKEKLVVDSHVTIVRPGECIEPKYVHYWVMSPAVQNSIEAMQSGSTNQVELSKGAVESTPIPLPPLEQQKRIVAKIEELFSHIDAGIAALKKAKQLLKQYRQSVLKAAVTGELTRDLPCRQAGWRDKSFRNISGKLVPENDDKYFTYVLECEDGSLYKGFSKNLFVRIDQHLAGKGAKWTKEHKPVSIIHFEEFETEQEAVEREKYFKSGSGREWLNQIREEHNKKYEPATQLLERILKERRQKWENEQLRQFTAKGLPAPKKDRWWLYVLLCDDNRFSIGVTEDMPRRWSEHTSGQGAEYTKKHKPISIIHHEEFKSQKEAYNREQALKTGLGREWLKREYEKGTLKQAGKMPKGDKWKEKYKEPELGSDRFFSEIPEEWAVASIDQLAWDVRYGSSSKANDNEKGVPVLRMGNIVDGQLDYTNLKYLPKNHDEFPDLLLEDGDLLFNRTNSAELVGKTAVFRDIDRQASLASYLIRVRVVSAVEPDFATYFINSSCGRNWIKSCVSQNVGQANVNGTKLKALVMPLPSLEEQKEIVRVVEEKMQSSDRLLAELDHELLKAEKNKQSILAFAYAGRIIKG